jgi:hypothetical protein
MAAPRHRTFRRGDVVLMIGTMKGLFLLRSSPTRSAWELAGPYFAGRSVYAAAFDQRADRHRLWVGQVSDHWGPGISWSDDFGRTWKEETSLRFPVDTGKSLERVWQIRPGLESEPNTLYCGVSPAALFKSTDNGGSWDLVRGLWNHPHRENWQPGGGGLCLHTIVLGERGRITVAVSTGGVYRSDDGGDTWTPRNSGIRADFMPDTYPEFGQCVHKVVNHRSRPDVMFLQNHWGLYRSDDAGDHWKDIGKGVPSDFGFAMAMHPRDPDVVYIVPIESDMYRCTPEGKLRVYRTKGGGRSWEALTKGLPQTNALETVLRDGLATDPLRPAGVYFGTRSGKVWGSKNDGDTWRLVYEGLPPVVCVKAAVVGEPANGPTVRRRTTGGSPRPKAPGRRKPSKTRAKG